MIYWKYKHILPTNSKKGMYQMKKLISTLCVLAMMMSMTVASAAKVSNRNIVEWRLISRTDSEAVLQVHINTNKTIAAYAMYWDFSDAFAKGATNVSIKPNAYNDNRVNFVTSNGKAFAVIADVDIYGVSTNTPLATVTVSGITEEFTIRLQGDSPRTRTHIAGYDGNNFTSEFSFPNAVVQRFTPITGIKLSSKESSNLRLRGFSSFFSSSDFKSPPASCDNLFCNCSIVK